MVRFSLYGQHMPWTDLEDSLDWESTVRPVVSIRCITRWSRTILRLARSTMSSSTLFRVTRR